MPKKRALLSVSDKTGINEFARELSKMGVQILSTGGTAKLLRENGIEVQEVSDYTGLSEMMDGRVKTLHPKIHGGLLGLRDNPAHREAMKEHGIEPIDLVVVNLYPFEKTVAKEGVTEEEAIENIDIGGPSMLRSAAKNFAAVTVVTDPSDYELVIEEMRQNNGETNLNTRKKLARKVFTTTMRYDEAIDAYFRKILDDPELLSLHYEKVFSLRYGENPQQKAAFFRNPDNHDANIPNAKILQGKQLSFNNIVDSDSALELVKEFLEPTVVMVKHNNPCGVASDASIEVAFEKAHQVDEMSAFGCIIAMNRPFTKEICDYMFQKKMFVEIVVAPDFTSEALEILKQKKNLRLLKTGELKQDFFRTNIKKVAGGILIQTVDTYQLKPEDLTVVTKLKPTDQEIQSMIFANKVAKHVRSNAVVMAKGTTVTAIGAGQMSRVDSVMIAGFKGGERVKDSVMASDAFFPFPDAMEKAAEMGVKAFIQPGGSVNDEAVIKRADELQVSMVFSGRRYFKH